MNSRVNYEEDPLRQYILRDGIEKAPEDFTSDVMSRIAAEGVAVRHPAKVRGRITIPAVSLCVVLALTISAFLLKNHTATERGLISGYIPEFSLSLVVEKIVSIFDFSIPGWFPFLAAGILFLAVFDRALFRAFHKEGF